MATLYKRSTPSQKRILRIIEGAVKNAEHAHPETKISDRFARSIAKRAAGTISAQWPELLAVVTPSARAVSDSTKASPSSAKLGSQRRGGRHTWCSRPSFHTINVRLGAMAGWARKAGHLTRAAAFEDALRVIASVEAELKDRS